MSSSRLNGQEEWRIQTDGVAVSDRQWDDVPVVLPAAAHPGRLSQCRSSARQNELVVISTDDRMAVHELIALHGHLVDAGQLERLPEVFTHDVVYDLTPMSGPTLHGVRAVSEAAQRLGDRNPVAHL